MAVSHYLHASLSNRIMGAFYLGNYIINIYMYIFVFRAVEQIYVSCFS